MEWSSLSTKHTKHILASRPISAIQCLASRMIIGQFNSLIELQSQSFSLFPFLFFHLYLRDPVPFFLFLHLDLLALLLPLPRIRPRLGGGGGHAVSSSGGGGGGGSSSLSDAGGVGGQSPSSTCGGGAVSSSLSDAGGGSGRDVHLAGGFPIVRVWAASTVDRGGALIAPLLELIVKPTSVTLPCVTFGPAGNTTLSCGCKRPSLLSLARKSSSSTSLSPLFFSVAKRVEAGPCCCCAFSGLCIDPSPSASIAEIKSSISP